jgi:MFS family permease
MSISQTRLLPFLTPALIISTLGYFVDTFDIVIFSIVRVPSLTELGYAGDLLTQKGIFLINMQLAGMLAGGLLWGFIGDTRGRSSALLLSILCYALANIANGFVHDVNMYAVCRFVSGVGLAGELSAAVTLIMESLKQKERGYGAMVITVIGGMGALTAASFGHLFYWRHLYFLGGAMGLLLLLARSAVKDSELCAASKSERVTRGDVLAFFRTPRMFRQFMTCFLIGLPHYLFFIIFITLSPEIARAMELPGTISVPTLLMVYAAFLCLGDLSATLLSQFLQSRKKAVTTYVVMASLLLALFYLWPEKTVITFYVFFGFIGFFAGYFMLTPVITAETFGTNLRATATSLVTNLVRAGAIFMSMGVEHLRHLGILSATQIVSAVVLGLTLWAAFSLKETFHKDMNFFD